MQHPCPYFGREHNTYKVNSIRQKGLLVSPTGTHVCGPHHLWKSPKKGERDRNCGLPWGCLAAVPQLIACAVTSKPAFVKQFLTTTISQGAIEYEPFSKSGRLLHICLYMPTWYVWSFFITFQRNQYCSLTTKLNFVSALLINGSCYGGLFRDSKVTLIDAIAAWLIDAWPHDVIDPLLLFWPKYVYFCLPKKGLP